jgi:prevent-host-death family protein
MATKNETVINTHEAKTHLSKLLARAAAGERIVIAKAGKPMAVLQAYDEPPPKRPLGLGKGKIVIHDNFDDPMPEWEELTI